jgi:hypothetical protein
MAKWKIISYVFRWALLLAVAPLFFYPNLSAQCAPTAVIEKPVAVKLFEIGNVSRRVFQRNTRSFWKSYDSLDQLYIINYGSDSAIARREKSITEMMIAVRDIDRVRITLVNGGPGNGRKTVFWKVPPGADRPKP